MSDIATLGLKIDSSQATAAVAALNNLSAAGKTAAAASTGLSNAAGVAAKAHGSMSTQAMAAMHSIRGMTEQLAMGVPVTQVLAQQMNHLSYAATGPGGLKGAFGEALGAFSRLLSPMVLLGVGAVAVTGAAYLMNAAWKASALQFDDAAKAAGNTVAQMRALSSLAAGKGISDTDFIKATDKFAANTYDAKNNLGEFAVLLRANGKPAADFQSNFENVADLIQRASTDQQRLQLLQQAGLPATMQWARFMSQGADGVRQARTEAENANPALRALVEESRKFDEFWDSEWRKFKDGAFDAVTKVKAWLQGLSGVGFSINQWAIDHGLVSQQTVNRNALTGPHANSTTNVDYGAFYGATGAPNGSKASQVVDPAVLRKQISDQQQALSLLGSTATATEAVRQVELALETARLNGIPIDVKRAEILKQLAYDQAIGTAAIKSSIDTQNVEAATIGMSVEAATAYTAAQTALNDAKRAGRELTAQNVIDINNEAAALGQAAARTDELKFEYDTFSGTMRDFGTQIRQGATAFDALRTAGANALGKIADRLMDMASRNLWNAAFPTGGSGGGGIFGALGSLFGIGGGPTGVVGGAGSMVVPTFSAKGNVFSNGISDYSNQIVTKPTFFAKGGNVMGEAGPEAVMPLVRTPDGNLGVRAGGGGGAPSVTIVQNNTFNNADPGSEARMRVALKQTKDQAVSEAVQAVAKVHSQAPGSYLRGVR